MVRVSVDPAPLVEREDVRVIPLTAGGVAPAGRTVTGVVSASVTDGRLVPPGMFWSVPMMLAVPALACAVMTPVVESIVRRPIQATRTTIAAPRTTPNSRAWSTPTPKSIIHPARRYP